MTTGFLINLTETSRPLLLMMTQEKEIPEDAHTMAVTGDGYLFFNEEQSKEVIKNAFGERRFLMPRFAMFSYHEIELAE
jgi:hypothetical protein